MAVTEQKLNQEASALKAQLVVKFPQGLPEKCVKLVQDVDSGVLTTDEALQLATVYEEEDQTEKEADAVLEKSARDMDASEDLRSPTTAANTSSPAPVPIGIAPHVLSHGYLSFQASPQGAAAAPASTSEASPATAAPGSAPAVSISSHVLSYGYARKLDVGIAPHVLGMGYYNLLQTDIRISPYVIWGGYLKVDLCKA